VNLEEFFTRFAHLSDEAFLANFERPFLLEEGKLSLEGERQGARSVFPLKPSPEGIRIGRNKASDVRIRHEQVSSRHAVIWPPVRAGDPWVLMDQSSTNGTFVDGERIEPGERVALESGMLIRFGLEPRASFLSPRDLLELLRRLDRPSAEADTDAIDPLAVTTRHGLSGQGREKPTAAEGEFLLTCEQYDPIPLREGQEVVVGRSPRTADLVLAHPQVSRRHCVVERRGEQVFLRDLGSANGVLVCDVRLGPSPTAVLPGKPIVIGPFTLYVERQGAEADLGRTQVVTAAATAERRVDGDLADASLADLLQEVEAEQRTGRLDVEAGALEGWVTFRSGEPWAAETSAGDEGVGAIRRLLALDRGRFGLSFLEGKVAERKISMTFGEILLDEFFEGGA